MPTYEFKCGACTHQFEVFQSMSDPDPEVCEQCGAAAVEKVLFAPAIHYKGSGFYATDYAGRKSTSSAGAASEAAGGESAGGSTSDAGSTSSSSGEGSSTSSSSGSTESSD